MGRYSFGKFKNIDKLKYAKEGIKNLVLVIVISLLLIFIIFFFDSHQNTVSSNIPKLILALVNYSIFSYQSVYIYKNNIHL